MSTPLGGYGHFDSTGYVPDGMCSRCLECDYEDHHPGPCDCGHKCPTCKNYYSVCGHDLPFVERVKSVSVQRLWAQSSH